MSFGAAEGVVVSASSITAVATSGSHMLKINGYSVAKLAMSNGSCIGSSEFEAAGHAWCINYYPNGSDNKEAVDHISLFLRLARNVNNVVVNARFRFSLVPHLICNDGAGGSRGKTKPKPTKTKPQVVPYQRQSLAAAFRGTYCQGFPCFVRREVLEKSEYLVDDSFAIRCDIDVVKTSAVSDVTVEADDRLRLSLMPCT